MIGLKCKNCGGKLSVEEDAVFASENAVMVRRGSRLNCEYCGSDYFPGDELDLATKFNIQVRQEIDTVESGGIVIGVKLNDSVDGC